MQNNNDYNLDPHIIYKINSKSTKDLNLRENHSNLQKTQGESFIGLCNDFMTVTPKEEMTQFKNGKGPKRTFLYRQEKGHQAHERMFIIADQENANQNMIRHHFMSPRVAPLKEQKMPVLTGMWRSCNSRALRTGTETGAAARKTARQLLKHQKQSLLPQQLHCGVYTHVESGPLGYLSAHVHSSIIHSGLKVEASQCPPVDEHLSKK